MPIYEYACGKCGKSFEYMQRMSDPPKRTCEACGEEALERQISQTSFQLKGSGWYKDLYSSPKPAASAGDAKGKSDGAGGSSGAASGSDSSSSAGSGSSSGSGSSGSGSSGSGPSKTSSEGTKPGKKAKQGT